MLVNMNYPFNWSVFHIPSPWSPKHINPEISFRLQGRQSSSHLGEGYADNGDCTGSLETPLPSPFLPGHRVAHVWPCGYL